MSEEHEPVIRVRDRRKFNPDGSPRVPDLDDADEVPPALAPAAASDAPPAAAAPVTEPQPTTETAAVEELPDDTEASAPEPARPGDASMFSDLVVQLATQAAMYLGLVSDPLGPKFPTDLRAARQMIDIIAMLRDKTAGNLTPDESVLLERVLTDLRMQYVSMAAPRR